MTPRSGAVSRSAQASSSPTARELQVDVRIRRLVMHQDASFAEHGFSIAVSYDPTPATPLGLNARVTPGWGGDAMSGADALWASEAMVAGAGYHRPAGRRLDAELGYGRPVGARFVGTPRVGVRSWKHDRDYRVGYGLGVLEGGDASVELGVDAQRRESRLLERVDKAVLGRATV